MIQDDGFCCTPDSGDCCGPGSWCCARAGRHSHDGDAETDTAYRGPLVVSTPDDPASQSVLYVAGFALSRDRRYVLLIRKARPSWQRGKLNAIGGKVDPGETPRQAMAREFSEEAGVYTRPDHWDHFATLEFGAGSRVLFFRTVLADDTMAAFGGITSGGQPDEPVRLYPVRDDWEPASSTRKPNLSFLLPLAAYTHDQLNVVRIKETGKTGIGSAA